MKTSTETDSHPTPHRSGNARRLLAATAALTLLVLAGACSAGSEDAAGSGSSADVGAPAPAGAPAEAEELADGSLSYDDSADANLTSQSRGGADTGGEAAPAVAQNAPGDSRALIKTGNVQLRSDDVPTARFDVGKVLDAHGGEIAEENTQADDEGDAERVRLVLRVPVAEFDATMSDLKVVADLIDVTTSSQDVSTEVIDNDVRVALQKRSIDRISVLLDNAADLSDIVNIERELSRREADLGSLEKRQAFLADQTAMSTITVSIEPPRKQDDEPVDDDRTGFLAGLDGGWTALKEVTTGLLTVGGAVLPFALVLLVLAVPGRLVVRRFRSRPQAVTASAAPAAPAS